MLLYLYTRSMARENCIFILCVYNSLALYDYLTTSGRQAVAAGTGRRNGPFISLKNDSFKEPLLSVHFACARGMRCLGTMFFCRNAREQHIMKQRTGDSWMPGSVYGRSLRGRTLNLLVRQIDAVLPFHWWHAGTGCLRPGEHRRV